LGSGENSFVITSFIIRTLEFTVWYQSDNHSQWSTETENRANRNRN
jgi:hypothetical protein